MIRRLISLVIKFVKSKPLLVFVLSLMFALSIYYFGEKLAISNFRPFKSESVRHISVLVIAFVAVLLELYFLATYIIKKRKEPKHKESASSEEKEKKPDCIITLEQQLKKIKDILAENWTKKTLFKRKGVYANPWYLIVGKQSSGKSALVDYSDFQYLLEDQISDINVDERKEKHAFRWKLSENSVFVEAKGSIFTDTLDENNEQLWLAFLDWLRAIREKRPLNGVILVVDIDDFIHLSVEGREQYAVYLKNKIRHLNNTLGLRLPIYLVLSKLDLLEGFTEFFSDLDEKDREQMLGFSFPLELNSSSYWKEALDGQYALFIDQLNTRLIRQAGREIENNRSVKIYSFVRQMVGLKPLLDHFMAHMFEDDSYSTVPLVRGLYFTSVYQQSLPVNAISESASMRYRVPVDSCQARSGRSVPYFVQRLLRTIVLPEVGVAGDSHQANLKRIRTHRWHFAFAGAIVAILTFGWIYYYQVNMGSIQRVSDELLNYSSTSVIDSQYSQPEEYFTTLETLRSALGRYEDYSSSNLFTHLGLYRGTDIAPEIDRAYRNELSSGFLRLLIKDVLENFVVTEDKRISSLDKLDALRVIRLLEEGLDGKDEAEKLALLKYKHQFVLPWMKLFWQQRHPNNAVAQYRLQRHLIYALDNVGANLDKSVKSDLLLEQEKLGRISLAHRLYAYIKSEGNRVLPPPINLRHKAGAQFDHVFQNIDEVREIPANARKVSVSRLFSFDGYHDFYIDSQKDLLSKASLDAWVLGKKKSVNAYSEADINKLKTQVNALYVEEYKQAWIAVLNNLHLLGFEGDINRSIKLLRSLNDADNPYRSILVTLKENTILYPGDEESKDTNENTLNADLGEIFSTQGTNKLKTEIGLPVARSFASLNGLLSTDKKEGKAYLDDIEQVFSKLYDYMRDIQIQGISDDGSTYALNKAMERLTLKEEDDPLYEMHRIANGMREPVRSHLHGLANDAWRVVLNLATYDLDKIWQQDVFSFYLENIAGRYPLVASNRDVSFRHFQDFFAKDGKLDVFYEKYLKLLLEDNRSEFFDPKHGISLISPRVMDSIKHADFIREGFFGRKGGYKVEFTIEPIDLSASYVSSTLNIDGVLIPYRHGQSYPKDMIWPNQIESNHKSSITINPLVKHTRQGYRSQSGSWSWFRLLDQSETNALGDRSRDIRFLFADGYVSYRLKVFDEVNPFTKDLFSGFALPKSLKPPIQNVIGELGFVERQFKTDDQQMYGTPII